MRIDDLFYVHFRKTHKLKRLSFAQYGAGNPKWMTQRGFRPITKKVDCIDTKCIITDMHDQVIAVGTARQNPQDQYDKYVGKKLALQRALERAGVNTGLTKAFHHTFKERIWREFFHNFKPGVTTGKTLKRKKHVN